MASVRISYAFDQGDGQEQGFVVGEIFDDGSITTRAVTVDYHKCCCVWYYGRWYC